MLYRASAYCKQQGGELQRDGSLLYDPSPPFLVLVKKSSRIQNIKLIVDVVEEYSKKGVCDERLGQLQTLLRLADKR